MRATRLAMVAGFLARIGEIESEAAEARSVLDRAQPEGAKVQAGVAGEAGELKGIVEAAILEGVVGAARAEARCEREAEAGDTEASRPAFALAVVSAGAMFALGVFASAVSL